MLIQRRRAMEVILTVEARSWINVGTVGGGLGPALLHATHHVISTSLPDRRCLARREAIAEASRLK